MTRTLDFVLADVFTDRPFGGNPLAVFPRVRDLADETMQAIARELNLSETTFVFPPADAGVTCTVRIFTPGTELPFAGHPTIGTGCCSPAVTLARTRPVREHSIPKRSLATAKETLLVYGCTADFDPCRTRHSIAPDLGFGGRSDLARAAGHRTSPRCHPCRRCCRP